MSSSTHAGFSRCGVPLARSVASHRLVPACALLPGRLRLPLLFASPQVGVGHGRRTAIPRGSPIPLPLYPFAMRRSRRASHVSTLSPSFGLLAVGVGHEEDPLSLVGRAHIGSLEPRAFHRETSGVELGDNDVQTPPSESTDVLEHDDPGADGVDGVEAPPEEPGALALEPGAVGVGLADVLARKARDEDVDPTEPTRLNCCGDSLDIAHPPVRVGEVPREHATAVRLGLDLPRRQWQPGPVQAEVEEADPGASAAKPHAALQVPLEGEGA